MSPTWTIPKAFPPRVPHSRPASKMTREPSLALPIAVCGSACVNGLRRPRAHTSARTRTRMRLYVTQLDSLMTRRIQESNSDDGSRALTQPRTRGVKGVSATLRMHACIPTLSRISMRAAPPIHAANYYRKRHNCARVQGKIGFLSTRFIHLACKAVSPGGSFCPSFSRLSPPPSPL